MRASRMLALASLSLIIGISSGQAIPTSENFLHLDNAIITTVTRDTPFPRTVRIDRERNDGCAYMAGANHIDKVCNYASSTPGPVTRVAGSTYTRKDGPLLTSAFYYIYDMEFYGAGQLLVCDITNDVINLVDLNAGKKTEFVGKGGSATTRDGRGTLSRFHDPRAITTNKAGGVFYVGGHANIRKVVWSTREVSRVAGHTTTSRGYVDGVKDVVRFNYIHGLAYHNNYIYACDRSNHRIRRTHATTGSTITFVGGLGHSVPYGYRDGDYDRALYYYPWNIVADGRLNPPVLYISTPHHNRVRVVDINSRKTWTVGGWGRLNQDGIGTYARFAEPHGLGIDWHSSNPRLLLADRDNNQIRLITRRTPNVRKMTRKGECTSSNRCGLCEADCDNDSQCVAGTKCFQRDGLTPVPGCLGGTNGDDSGADYCTDAPSVTRYPTPAPIALPPMSKVMDKSNANVQTVARIYYARYMDCDWSIGDCIVSSWHVNKLHRVVGGFHVSPQVIETVGTGSRTWRDGVFSVASFDYPGRPVLYGTVSYHPDYHDHRIRKIDWAAKMVYTVTRSSSGHRDGPVSVARFHYPTVMEKRTATRMFIAARAHLHEYDVTAGKILPVAGFYEQITPYWASYGSTDGLCTNARMYQPYALSYDSANDNLYYASRHNYMIRYVNLGAAQCTTHATLGRREWAGTHDGPSSMASFQSISAIRYHADVTRGIRYLYYACWYTDRVHVYDMDASYVRHIVGWSGGGLRDGRGTIARFWDPWDIVMRKDGVTPYSFYVVDPNNHAIRLVGETKTYAPTVTDVPTVAPTVTGMPTSTVTPTGSPAIPLLHKSFAIVTTKVAMPDRPNGVCVHSQTGSNIFYVSSQASEKIYRVAGSTATVLAGSSHGYRDGVGTIARFRDPREVECDRTAANPVLYIASPTSEVVRRVVVSSREVTTLSGIYNTRGYVDGGKSVGRLWDPRSVNLDLRRNRLLVGGYLRMHEINLATNEKRTFVGRQDSSTKDGYGTRATFCTCEDADIDRTNDILYFVDACREFVRKVELSSGLTTTMAGTGIDMYVDGPFTVASFRSPIGITFDYHAGNVMYVSSHTSDSIRVLDMFSKTVDTMAGAGANGGAGYRDGLGNIARFNNPWGMVIDPLAPSRTVHIMDYENRKIRSVRAAVTQTPTTKSPVTGSPTIEPVVECYSDDTSCGNWFGCEPGESCSTCCGKMSGKTCNDEVMYEHKCEVYTVQALTRQAEANSLNCTNFYPTLNNAAPFFQNGTCAFPHPRRPRANVKCTAQPDYPTDRRICFCSRIQCAHSFLGEINLQKCRWHPGRHARCLD